MSKTIKSVQPDMNAKEALKALIRSGASGLPVIDGQGILVGVFTEKEILKSILPSYLKDVGNFVYGEDSKLELKRLAHLDRLTVKDIMRTEVPTVTEETSLTEISHIMLTRSERRVMVVKGKKALGVITRADVVTALAKEAGVVL
jgi:CBS domain-containing protein